MIGPRLTRLVAFAATVALGLPAAAASLASHPLTTGLTVLPEMGAGDPGAVFDRLNRSAISSVGVSIDWASTAPASEPVSWNPSDPNDANYDWSRADAGLRAIAEAGFTPIALVSSAPPWARLAPAVVTSAPRAEDFAAFIHAAAERYSGGHPGLPRVRYWRIWNEPNISLFFRPQIDPATKRFVSPDIYRGMLNRSAAELHAVNKDNVVIAGGLSPFRDVDPEVRAVDDRWGPLKFMRRLLCVDDAGRATCSSPVSFDIWSTHPYTSGGPTHHAQLPYDVSLGDLPKMRRTLDAAVRAGHVTSARRIRFWVTEFSWDSNKPDPCGVPTALLKRWVPEALYRMWSNGIEHVSWFRLVDDPLSESIFQSGLFFRAATIGATRPKPFLEGFRFPFVALRRGSDVYVWAHTPLGTSGRMTVEQAFKGGWKIVTLLKTDRMGIAQALLRTQPIGQFRATLVATGERSLPFSMRVPPDHFYYPFGRLVLTPKSPKSCTD